MLDEKGNPRFILEPGQRKAIATDRVVIVPGPVEALRVIRRIFRMYVTGQYSRTEIAERLNREGVATTRGESWSAVKVRNLLRNELCIGCYRYNASTRKLQSPSRSNPEHLWIRVATSKPIVSVKMFRRAQRRAAKRRGAALRDAYLLKRLQQLLKKKGRLSHTIVRNAQHVPSSSTYRNHFGSLRKAYALIDYASPYQAGNYEPWSDEELLSGLKALFKRQGYLTVKTINACEDIPCSDVFKRRFGSLKEAYQAAGLPVLTHSECQKAARRRQLEECRQPPNGKLRYDGSITTQRYSSEAIIKGLRKLHQKHGYLSGSIIAHADFLPSVPAIARRFGGLLTAYRAAGYDATRRQIQSAACVSRKIPKPRPGSVPP